MATKLFTRKEIKENKNDILFIIKNEVYEVSKFLDEHPGGHEVLVGAKGQDASEDFDDVGHSIDAKELMKKYKVGELVEEDRVEIQTRQMNWDAERKDMESGFLSSWKFPVLLAIAATILYMYVFD